MQRGMITMFLSWIWLPLTSTAHHPWTTSPIMHCTHTFRPPLHQSHSCHHSLINPDCLTTPAPHSLTHIKVAHKHSPSAKSCFPRLTFPSGFPSLSSLVLPGLFDSLSWSFAACLSDPAWFTGNPLCLPPALTHCSASDFDSALSTLPSIPLLDICLFDLFFVLIKLQVDLLLPLTSHSLQKTSPPQVQRLYFGYPA